MECGIQKALRLKLKESRKHCGEQRVNERACGCYAEHYKLTYCE